MILDKKSSKHIAEILSHILADTYILYVKTQNFHWNVVDPQFHSLHLFFEEQYKELANAVDEIAERIRMLGVNAPATMKEFIQLGSLDEAKGYDSADRMIEQLLHDHEAICKHMRPNVDRFTEVGDHGSADLLIERLRVHEKAAWMLRSSL